MGSYNTTDGTRQDSPALSQGVYDNLPADEYHRVLGLTKSGLSMLRKSPAHFWNWLSSPPEPPSKAMNLGTATHTLVFEPHKWQDEITVIPADAPKKATLAQRNAKKPSEEAVASMAWWDKFDAETHGRALITAEEEVQARAMAQAVLNHSEVAPLLKHPSAKAERSLMCVEKVNGIDISCKGRCDLITMDNTVIVDLKTCEDASPEAFGKSFMSFGYWLQAVHYLKIAQKAGLPTQRFIFIAVEKNPPYSVALYELDEQSLEKSIKIRERLLAVLADCIARNEFPAYSKGVTPLTLPPWIN